MPTKRKSGLVCMCFCYRAKTLPWPTCVRRVYTLLRRSSHHQGEAFPSYIWFGSSVTNSSAKLLIGNSARVFSKQSAQLVILQSNLNHLIRLVANFEGSFGQIILSNFQTKTMLG